jgi:hypothetical protein
MPIISTEAMNASLANDYGPTRGAQAADNLELGILTGDPRFGGVEFDSAGGYTRLPVDQDTDWATPADGKITALLQFPDSTDAWTVAGDVAQGTWWQLYDADTGDAWDGDALDEAIVVTDAGSFAVMPVTVYHPDALVDTE